MKNVQRIVPFIVIANILNAAAPKEKPATFKIINSTFPTSFTLTYKAEGKEDRNFDGDFLTKKEIEFPFTRSTGQQLFKIKVAFPRSTKVPKDYQGNVSEHIFSQDELDDLKNGIANIVITRDKNNLNNRKPIISVVRIEPGAQSAADIKRGQEPSSDLKLKMELQKCQEELSAALTKIKSLEDELQTIRAKIKSLEDENANLLKLQK